MGIEPTLSAWEAEALPLNYTRWEQEELSAKKILPTNPVPNEMEDGNPVQNIPPDVLKNHPSHTRQLMLSSNTS